MEGVELELETTTTTLDLDGVIEPTLDLEIDPEDASSMMDGMNIPLLVALLCGVFTALVQYFYALKKKKAQTQKFQQQQQQLSQGGEKGKEEEKKGDTTGQTVVGGGAVAMSEEKRSERSEAEERSERSEAEEKSERSESGKKEKPAIIPTLSIDPAPEPQQSQQPSQPQQQESKPQHVRQQTYQEKQQQQLAVYTQHSHHSKVGFMKSLVGAGKQKLTGRPSSARTGGSHHESGKSGGSMSRVLSFGRRAHTPNPGTKSASNLHSESESNKRRSSLDDYGREKGGAEGGEGEVKHEGEEGEKKKKGFFGKFKKNK
eukprot:CAMPEP_0201512780 /NCGR_PEP_ID=MMETSP0161_2-20130828/4973_1 /ASSEMBLY_ACC=CAM_ASM_000251 /TAXON_ID=180227 /ORGANISM="Neoparamoeba aestuarina, Strain SoJaBio B1-5/56/2" /LENGTH=315 /DNA_ID=CAMNT_0047908757 /DNA_START=150 /DNA_END=1097 /DNA_ORIENTATION=-